MKRKEFLCFRWSKTETKVEKEKISDGNWFIERWQRSSTDKIGKNDNEWMYWLNRAFQAHQSGVKWMKELFENVEKKKGICFDSTFENARKAPDR